METPRTNKEPSYEVAAILGGRVERSAAELVSKLEDFSLRLLEEAATIFPENEALNIVDQNMVRVHRSGRRLPQVAGWLAVNAIYLGLRGLLETAAALESIADGESGRPQPEQMAENS